MRRVRRNFGRVSAATLGLTVGLWSLPLQEPSPSVPVRQPGHELLSPGVCAELVEIVEIIGVPGESLLDLTALREEPLGPEMKESGTNLAEAIAKDAGRGAGQPNNLANLAVSELYIQYPKVENFGTDPESADSALLVAQQAVMDAHDQCSATTVAVGTNV